MKIKAILLTLVLCSLYNEGEAKDVHNDSIKIRFVKVECEVSSTIQGDALKSDDDSSSKKQKSETYYISVCEITNEQWGEVMGEEYLEKDKNSPKVKLSYKECMEFIDSLKSKTGKTFRLPTEKEWKYAVKVAKKDKPNDFGIDVRCDSVPECTEDLDDVKKDKQEYCFRIVYDDSKERGGNINILLPRSQNKNNDPKYIYWCILLVLVCVSIVYIFLRKREKTRMSIRQKDSSINQISDKTADETNTGKKTIDVVLPDTPVPSRPLNNESSNDKHNRFSIDCDNCLVVGASVRGKGHIQTELPCQDNNKYTYLTNGWGIAVVSDGAGSASKSQIGSKIVVERATTHFVDVIREMEWIEQNVLPSNEDWAQIAYSVLRRVYNDIADFAQQKNIAIKNLSATVIVLIHSPLGILSTHIGDGRAGYRNCNGEWHSIIAPHKGEEANQTIFITSQFWDRPSFRMSGHLIPESVIIRENVSGFTLMSDGCENTSWQISQMDRNTGKVCDPNQPFQKFFDPLTNTLIQFHNDRVDANKRAEAWYTFLDTSKEFSKEVDDKTLILGIIL